MFFNVLLGMLLVYMRLPSANRSSKNPVYDKLPMLAFTKEPQEHFGYKHEARFIGGYRCSTRAKNVPDVGSRVLGWFLSKREQTKLAVLFWIIVEEVSMPFIS